MSRIELCFAELKKAGKKALIPYIAAGDPDKSITVPLMHRMVEKGASIIELGVPFSDPMADGPTIQLSMERALVHHTSLTDVLGMVSEFRQHDANTPVILMGYLNPIERMGFEAFAHNASEAGVDGLLTVDMPPEESEELSGLLKAQDIDGIFLLSPTTTSERMKLIADSGSGFLYYVSLKGVTGANTLDVSEVEQRLGLIREHTHLPLGVGFGIKDADTAQQVASVADAVVVGSAIIKLIEQNLNDHPAILDEVGELIGSMRQAMDGAG